MNIPESIKEIIQNLKNQDNRCTHLPVFCIQRKRRDFGYTEECSDNFIWMIDGEEADEEEIAACEKWDDNEQPKGAWKQYYLERWETVQACFTEKGAEDYIRADGHNLGETRVYVNSGYRNRETEAIRDFLLSLD